MNSLLRLITLPGSFLRLQNAHATLGVLFAAALGLAGATVSSAQVPLVPTVADYTFTDGSLTSDDTDTSSTAGAVVTGAGFTGFAAPMDFFTSEALFVGSDHTPGTEADAITGNDYFSFTVTPFAGGTLKFDTLNYQLDTSNHSSAINVNIAVRWSVDNFATTLDTATDHVGSGQSSASGSAIDLNSFPAQSGPVEIRFYVYDNQNSQFSQVGIDGISLTAAYQAPTHSQYRLIDLGLLPGGDASVAEAINASGQVVGYGGVPHGHHPTQFPSRAFLSTNGVLKNLGLPKGGSDSEAHAINTAGTVVGRWSNAQTFFNAFVYTKQKIVNLAPPVGFTSNVATGINTAGQIVGGVFNEKGGTAGLAYLYQSGSFTTLAPLTGDTLSYATAINDGGMIVGGSFLMTGAPSHAVLWGSAAAAPTDLGTFGGDLSYATGINASGNIVGYANATNGGADHAFFYDTTMHDLGAGRALGINASNDVVGGDASGRAFLYTVGTKYALQDLVAPADAGGFQTMMTNPATGINDQGWIVGSGVASDGATHAFLAVPTSVTTTLIAAKGDAAPGLAPATFSVFGSPAIDAAGDVAFHAVVKGGGTTKANNAGIWLYHGATGTLVARTGDAANAAPGTNGAPYTKLSDPVLSSAGALAFVGNLKPGTGDAIKATDGGIWFSQNGTTNLITRLGDDVPGAPAGSAKITAFNQIGLDQAGGLSLLANLKGNAAFPATGAALFGADNSGTLTLLDRKGGTVTGLTAFKPLPGVAGQSRSFDATTGDALYLRTEAGAGSSVILQIPGASGFNSFPIMATGAPLPPGIDTDPIKSLGEPAINANSNIAVLLTESFGPGAHDSFTEIVLLNSGFSYVITRIGYQAPDKDGFITDARFFKLGDPVLNNSNRTAFIGTADNTPGVWSDASGFLKLIAQKGDDAPGYGGGKFASFKQIVLPDVGGVVILATLSGVPAAKNQGVWAITANGTLGSIVRKGDVLDVNGTRKTVKTLGIFQLAPFVMGQSRSFDASTDSLVYQATFTDGTWAIFKATP